MKPFRSPEEMLDGTAIVAGTAPWQRPARATSVFAHACSRIDPLRLRPSQTVARRDRAPTNKQSSQRKSDRQTILHVSRVL